MSCWFLGFCLWLFWVFLLCFWFILVTPRFLFHFNSHTWEWTILTKGLMTVWASSAHGTGKKKIEASSVASDQDRFDTAYEAFRDLAEGLYDIDLTRYSRGVTSEDAPGVQLLMDRRSCKNWCFFFCRCRARLKLRRSSNLLFRLSIPMYENISETDTRCHHKTNQTKNQKTQHHHNQKPKSKQDT